MNTASSQHAQPISGSTRVFMVIGDPVSQVQAPVIFNAIFRQHGVDAVLVPARVAPSHLEGFVRHVVSAGLCGIVAHSPSMVPALTTWRCPDR